LHDDIGTVPVFFDHLLQTANLTLDPAQPFEIGKLDLRVDPDRLPAIYG
jgi:hypothetical protein